MKIWSLRPLVQPTSSRIRLISSHPDARNAVVIILVQMSRSLRDFLSMHTDATALQRQRPP